MGIINLALRCPKSFHGLTTDPQPDWGWDDIISELNVLEQKLSDSSGGRPLSTRMEFPSHKAFVMRVSDDEMEDTESSDEDSHNQSSMTGRRFACGELDLSDTDGSEDELDLETTGNRLMDKTGLEEGILIELEREHQLRVKEEIRNRLYALEADMKNENERSVAVRGCVEKYIEEKRETDRRLDKQYQRKIAEALESHLSAVQRDHQQISLIEERRIRSDAEEAKRKETALLEEKARQERAKAEAEAKLKAAKVAEEMQKAALDAERRAKEAAEKVANEKSKTVAAEEVQRDANIKSLSGVRGGDGHSKELGSDAPDKVRSAGINIKAAETALRLEEERLGKYKEVAEMNNRLRLGSNKNIQSYERQIARRVKQISGTQENFREKASDLVKIVNDPLCPQSISIAMFAKQVVSLCEVSIGATAFACARIIVIVTSQKLLDAEEVIAVAFFFLRIAYPHTSSLMLQDFHMVSDYCRTCHKNGDMKVPVAMDIVLAEFHKACIYTVPKHIRYSESAFKTKEAYYKAIGYQEKEGKIESTTSYLQRVEAYMTLYAALVQTEINGFRNLHGLKEGWAWLARFLNTLPVEPSTAVALLAFLRVAGFMLFRRYKSQFRKILNIVSREFLASLKNLRDPQANQVIEQIECYIESNQYLQEPQGWQLQTSLQSKAY